MGGEEGEVRNKYVTIRRCIEKLPQEEDFELMTATISVSMEAEPGSGRILVKCLQISIDPGQINRMKICDNSSQSSSTVSSQLLPGKPIDGYGVGRVMASRHPDFQKGDLVAGMLIWADYAVVEHNNFLRKLDPTEFPLSYHLGIIGLCGFTAYAGFFQVCKPKKGETILVSAAAGAIGNLVGQYAKLFGCYVVGCAGSAEKVSLLKEKFGFDDAFNYKEAGDLNLALKRYFPNGIDMYFDNVGGQMLEAAVANMNPFGRVSVCGVISQYTDSTKKSAPDMIDVIYKQITIQGFFSAHLVDESFEEFLSTTTDHLRAGKMQALECISHGLESVPSAFVGLFQGRNIGKTIVQIANE